MWRRRCVGRRRTVVSDLQAATLALVAVWIIFGKSALLASLAVIGFFFVAYAVMWVCVWRIGAKEKKRVKMPLDVWSTDELSAEDEAWLEHVNQLAGLVQTVVKAQEPVPKPAVTNKQLVTELMGGGYTVVVAEYADGGVLVESGDRRYYLSGRELSVIKRAASGFDARTCPKLGTV